MKNSIKLPVLLTSLFLVLMIAYFVFNGNYEFIGYAGVVALLLFFVVKLDEKYDFPAIGIWLFCIWVVMHLLGGSIYLQGTRLYDLILIDLIGSPYFILKYDQVVHAVCFFTFSILVYFILKKHMKQDQTISLICFTILATLGISLLNEIMEFGMVVFADAAQAVGDYYNTALDMVFNLIGAVIGVFFTRNFLDKY